VPGPIDSTLEQIEDDLRDLRRQLSTLEAFRRQLVGADEEPHIGVPGTRGETLHRRPHGVS
jgi:hypothetical protein